MMKKLSPSPESSSEDDTSSVVEDPDDIWSHHRVQASRNVPTGDDEEGLPTELRQFLNQPVIPLKLDPLQYLENYKAAFPRVYQVARNYLYAPATSVPAERLFSKSGNVMSIKRNRLSPKHLHEIIMLNSLDNGVRYEL